MERNIQLASEPIWLFVISTVSFDIIVENNILAFTFMINTIRNLAGVLIVAIDKATRPAATQRSEVEQQEIADKAANLSLYQFYGCPFCVKIRRWLHRNSIPMTCLDAINDEKHRLDLLEGGGKIQVPCLKIEENGHTTWLYESKDIICFLEKRLLD